MKKFIIFYLIFFPIFFLIGFKKGYEEVREPGFLFNKVFEKVSYTEINQKGYLVYKKDSTDLYIFNIDSNNLIKIDKEYLLTRNSKKISDQNILSYLNSTFFASLGAGALGYTIKDLFKNSSEIKDLCNSTHGRGAIFGTILGMITGYSSGHWTSTHSYIPTEGSPLFSNILISNSNWIEGKKLVYEMIYNKIVYSIYYPDKTDKVNSSLLNQLKLIYDNIAIDKTNQLILYANDFKTLINYYKKVNEINQNYRRTMWQRIEDFFAFESDFYGEFLAIIIILYGLFVFFIRRFLF